MYYVYVFQNKENNKIYVGKTNNLKERLRKHLSTAKKIGKQIFHKALNKYGIDGFNYFPIEEWDTEQDALDAEKFWIEYFRSNVPGYGYNETSGGEGVSGRRHSDETKKKLSLANKGKKMTPDAIAAAVAGRQGYVHTEATKQLISKSKIGKQRSSETKSKISEALSGEKNANFGKRGELSHHFGKKHSETTLNKMRKLSPETIAEILIKYETGDYTQLQLANEYGVCSDTINRWINNRINTGK